MLKNPFISLCVTKVKAVKVKNSGFFSQKQKQNVLNVLVD